MRIAFAISALGRGGAEQQLIRLAIRLKDRGNEVSVWCYGGASSIDDQLRAVGIEVLLGPASGRFTKISTIRRWIKEWRPDVLHAFMKRASSLAVLARGFGRRPAIVGSDLSTATYGNRDLVLLGSLLLFARCNAVATQTELNRASLERLAPWLRGRTHVIRNGLDLERFAPSHRTATGNFRFACVGTVYRIKNPLRLVKAVGLLVEKGVRNFRVDWYGRLGLKGDDSPSAEYYQCMEYVNCAGLTAYIKFHGECSNIERAYHNADALVHPSLQEGFPNAVVEGMAVGLPVVVSHVSDLPLVVERARNGFVVDQLSVESIQAGMLKMMATTAVEREAMSTSSRQLAIQWFGLDRFVDDYVALYRSVCSPSTADDRGVRGVG